MLLGVTDAANERRLHCLVVKTQKIKWNNRKQQYVDKWRWTGFEGQYPEIQREREDNTCESWLLKTIVFQEPS